MGTCVDGGMGCVWTCVLALCGHVNGLMCGHVCGHVYGYV